jgi:hypothetical protein
MERIVWAPSIKRELGDVWHLATDGHAKCDPRVRLSVDEATKGEPDGYRCKRCEQLNVTVLKKLEDGRIFSVTRTPEGLFRFEECCDQYFARDFTKEDVLRLAGELVALVNTEK